MHPATMFLITCSHLDARSPEMRNPMYPTILLFFTATNLVMPKGHTVSGGSSGTLKVYCGHLMYVLPIAHSHFI